MPGTHLSSTERALLTAWESSHFGPFPLLKSISVSASRGNGLRGIKQLRVDFHYPVTFLSGQNGCGKSTLLSLAALAFHGHRGHVPASAASRRGRGAEAFGYYTFQDFFHRGPGDADAAGVRIEWCFSTGKPVQLDKKTDKWMRYERRPARPAEFIGLSRALPAIELPTLRNHFGLAANAVAAPLSGPARSYLERVLSRAYPGAEVLSGQRYAIRRTAQSGGYTSFNMGTGEDALFRLFARLERVPKGSLVVIEELETGLHPAAQERATRALLEIALNRQLQIIASTHSQHVLDQLPRQARILVVREPGGHRVVPAPSTKFALSELAECSHAELLVVCEDEFAASLIRAMLPKATRRRVAIKSCGSKNELAIQAQCYLRMEPRARCLIVWDGDVKAPEAEGYVRSAQSRFPLPDQDGRLAWTTLPGGCCPELWALQVAKTEALNDVKALLGFESDGEALAALEKCGLADPHRITFDLSTLVELPSETVANHLASCVARAAVSECQHLVSLIERILKASPSAADRLAA